MAKEETLLEFKTRMIERLTIENGIRSLIYFTSQMPYDPETLFKFQASTGDTKLFLTELKKEEILKNPYLSGIKIPRVTSREFALANRRLVPAMTVNKYHEKFRDPETLEQITNFWNCKDNLRFPALIEGKSNTPWMTVEPSEIISFKPFIEKASGNILLCGLGLGYVAYMLSLKEDVKSITVVERSEDVIALFKSAILPQFENGDKINIVHADAIEHLKRDDLGKYNFVNVDIWFDTADMLVTYLKCLKIARKYPSVDFSFWLEKELKCEIQGSLLSAIVDFPIDISFYREIAEDLLKGKSLRNVSQIKDFVRMDNFREVMLDWYLKNPKKAEDIESIVNPIVKGQMQ